MAALASAPRSTEKNAKKTAELIPLDSARGQTPANSAEGFPPPRARAALAASRIEGLEAALHIMFVLTTSRGVVAAAATAPATAPIAKSSPRLGGRGLKALPSLENSPVALARAVISRACAALRVS